jgi:hypothetical protein
MTLVSSKTLGNGGRFPSRDNQHGQYLRIPQTYPETYYLLGITKTAPKWQERQMPDDLPERILGRNQNCLPTLRPTALSN